MRWETRIRVAQAAIADGQTGLIRNSGFTSSHGAAAVSKNQETARQKYLLAAAGRDGLITEGA